MEKEPRSESHIIKEAENIIDSYIKCKKKSDKTDYKEKYLRLKILSIIVGIVSSLGILFTVIFK